jgi:MFS transporter, ACS family, glucarate transporter
LRLSRIDLAEKGRSLLRPYNGIADRAPELTMAAKTLTNLRWLLIAWLFVLSAVAFLDRVNMSVAAPRMIADYRLTDVQFGLLSSAFLLGYALLQTPAGWFADRWGPRRVLTGGVVWWGIFTATTASIPLGLSAAFALLLLARFCLGVGEAVMYPGSSQFVSRWIPTHERGLANGLIFAGVGIGSAASPPFVTYMLIHHGWRFSFWMCALIGLAVGVVWYLASRDTPEQHPLVSPGELSTIRTGLTLGTTAASGTANRATEGLRADNRAVLQPQGRAEARLSMSPGMDVAAPVVGAEQSSPRLGNARSARSSAPSVPWRIILSNSSVWAITISYFCYGYIAWIFFAWFYVYLARVRGMNLKASAFFGMLPFLAMALGCAAGGVIADSLTKRISRRSGRCGVAIVGMALTALFLAFGSTVNSAPLASVILAGGAGALYLSQSSYWAITADIGGRFAGSLAGFMNMGCQFGGALTAFLTPYIALHLGWTASFLVAAGLSVVGALLWLFVNPDHGVASA